MSVRIFTARRLYELRVRQDQANQLHSDSELDPPPISPRTALFWALTSAFSNIAALASHELSATVSKAFADSIFQASLVCDRTHSMPRARASTSSMSTSTQIHPD